MARINSFPLDTNVSKDDKLLGTDEGGATKNFSVSSIGEHFAQSSAITIAGQLVSKFGMAVNEVGDGGMYFNGGEEEPQLSDITSVTISKKSASGSSRRSMLADIVATKFLMVESGNQDVKGEFTVTSSYDNANNSDFLDVMVTPTNTNGSVSNSKHYIIAVSATAVSGDRKYEHEQSSAADTWTIDHNLNKKPAVSVVDSLENIVICEVEYTSLNQVVLTFDTPYSGKAYFN
jgi:hypothetical protein